MFTRLMRIIFSLGLAWALIQPGRVRGGAAMGASLTITRGGTYTGQWTGDDPSMPVIVIGTAEPVIIENSTLRGRGNLIQTGVDHVQVIIRNCHATALNPNVAGRSPGRFFSGESFDSVDIENNDLEQTAGIYLLTYAGNPKAELTVRILANRAHNIDGRHSDGAGGFQTRTDAVQFVQLDKVQHVENVQIAWNQVINDPGASGVEDVISIYKSSGTKTSPISIHDNYIDGAYPADPLSADYSGGGIMLGDGAAENAEDASGFVAAFNNQVLNTTNYGMAISAGHHCLMHHNHILSTGTLANGTPLPAQNVGAYVWDAGRNRGHESKGFSDNGGYANRIGWMAGGKRHDWWAPNAARWSDNVPWPGTITLQTFVAERAEWDRKVAGQKISVGAR